MENAALPSREKPDRLPLLDGLRTVAALGVLLFHIPQFFDQRWLFDRTYLLVDLFFLLSGFVLALSGERKMALPGGSEAFLQSRLKRIWPLMALGACLGALVFATQTNEDQILWLLLLSLLAIPLVTTDLAVFPLNAPQWSLFWELVANFLHGLILWRLSDRVILAIALAGGAAATALVLHTGSGGAGGNAEHWHYAAPRLIWSYTLGIWMARKWLVRKPKPLADWRLALIMPVLALIALQYLPLAKGLGDAIAVIVVLPALFWVAVSAQPPQSTHTALGHFGAISFPLYALHMPVLLGFSLWDDSVPTSIVAALCAIALSIFVVWSGPWVRGQLARLLSIRPVRPART